MTTNGNTDNLYNSIKTLLENAKSQIVRNVNRTMVLTYFEIGRRLVEHEQKGNYRAGYAKELLAKISEKLTKEFGKGYALSNLSYFRQFYIIFQDRIPQSVIGEFRQFGRMPQSVI
ncbi:MAG TPA: DUF1016 N-terminal domain-containing protein [Chitinophagaceae bacterium]